jgi:uncharacterized LabA/DUF88 family protein
MAFVDGENLVFRYQSMKKTRTPAAGVAHYPDVFAWSPLSYPMTSQFDLDVVRASYYTSMVGDDDEIEKVTREIRKGLFWDRGNVPGLQAQVFKRLKKENRSRVVDVRISIDALHHAHEDHAAQFVLFTGDADFLPLVKALMREGKEVTVFEFSEGLSPALETAPDRMCLLDRFYFV